MRKLLGLILFIAVSAVNLQAANLRDLVSRSRMMIGDTPYLTPIARVSDQRIIDYLNEGQKYITSNGWFLTKRTSFLLVGGTTEYALPTDFQTVRRMSLDGSVIPETTLEALDYNSGSWIYSSGSPSQYYIRTTSVSVVGFFPAPLTTTTGTVTLDYITQTQDLSAQTDTPFLGLPELYPLHESLAKYVAYRYYALIGNEKLADLYAKEVLSDMKRMKEIIETKPNYKPGFGAVR